MADRSSQALMQVSSKQVAAYSRQSLRPFWQQVAEKIPDDQKSVIKGLLTPSRLKAMNRALLLSPFLQRTLLTRPEYLESLLRLPSFDRPLTRGFYTEQVARCVAVDEEGYAQQLRMVRGLLMARFIIQHFNASLSLKQLTHELSFFADACILQAVAWHHASLVARFGEPLGASSGEPQALVVLGMGKLGALELNISSDIDLIFAYPESGMTQGQESITNQEFFSLLGKRVIQTLNRQTADGFVFRVDMRLRPYGQSGLLVYPFQAMENYYQDQGREWERYAMIKARVIDPTPQGLALESMLKPFIYRRYTDFSALEGMRTMKALIVKEVRRLGKVDDIKLGAGGIREVEFIAQVWQLIHGGRKKALQVRSLEMVFSQLKALALLDASVADSLVASYRVLREVEHCLQGANDEQTHKLPTQSEAQKKLALAMRYDSWEAFIQALNEKRAVVRTYFDAFIDAPTTPSVASGELSFPSEKSHGKTGMLRWMQDHEFSSEEIEQVSRFLTREKIQKLRPDEWCRLKQCMQFIFPHWVVQPNRMALIVSVLDLLEAIVQRSIYLVLLNENPMAIERLMTIALSSPWAMRQFIQWPALLDELLEEPDCSGLSSLSGVSDVLKQCALRVSQDDLEEQMDMLRYFKMSKVLTIALAEVKGDLSLFSVSNDLTYLAESILRYVLDLAWHDLTQKFGYPTKDDKAYEAPPFAIVAYGKMGGLEMSYQSDLDLVFLYDAPMHGLTDGERRIDNVAFFTRLGQRIIHMLSTRTMMGQLYEIDMRLRPSGNKGLLVTSLTAFSDYQHTTAWTWEQQALVRARVVAGADSIAQQFNQMRQSILQMPRDMQTLATDVASMRAKMFDHLAPTYTKDEAAAIFDLKHSRWGIIDLEFMVQYAVLAFAHKFTQLTNYTDNIRILEVMADCHLITDQERSDLVNAYQAYRSYGHEVALKQEKNEAQTDRFIKQRHVVKAVWQKLIEPFVISGE